MKRRLSRTGTIIFFTKMLAVAAEAGIKTTKANEIINLILDVIGRFDEYVGDSIPEWMKRPILQQLEHATALLLREPEDGGLYPRFGC